MVKLIDGTKIQNYAEFINILKRTNIDCINDTNYSLVPMPKASNKIAVREYNGATFIVEFRMPTYCENDMIINIKYVYRHDYRMIVEIRNQYIDIYTEYNNGSKYRERVDANDKKMINLINSKNFIGIINDLLVCTDAHTTNYMH